MPYRTTCRRACQRTGYISRRGKELSYVVDGKELRVQSSGEIPLYAGLLAPEERSHVRMPII